MEATGPDQKLSTLLSCQLDAKSQDLEWMLAHFTFVADATTLAGECDIVCSPKMSVASYHGLPFPALAFLGTSPELLNSYATFLIEPGSPVALLVNEEQRQVVEQAFVINKSIPEWQMLFEGTPEALEIGNAVPLKPKNLSAMQSLAKVTQLEALEQDPFNHGPAFGIWEGRTLAAMGTTHLTIPQAVEIGNIATHPDYRHSGYATHIIAALIHAHQREDNKVFLMVYQDNLKAIQFYEKLGFQRKRPMYLMHCQVKQTTQNY